MNLLEFKDNKKYIHYNRDEKYEFLQVCGNIKKSQQKVEQKKINLR